MSEFSPAERAQLLHVPALKFALGTHSQRAPSARSGAAGGDAEGGASGNEGSGTSTQVWLPFRCLPLRKPRARRPSSGEGGGSCASSSAAAVE